MLFALCGDLDRRLHWFQRRAGIPSVVCNDSKIKKSCSKRSSSSLSADKSQLAEFGWVDLYARTHGGSQYAGSDILTLCSGRFCLYDGAHQGVKVLLQLLNTEGSLADRAVDDVGLVQTVLDLTSFRFLNRFDNVRSYGAGLRGWHQASWTKDFTQTANNAHHVRACDDNVEIHPATLDLLHVLVSAGIVCTSSQSSIHLVALAEYHDANGFAGAVWQNNRATNLLLSVTGVNTQSYVDLYSLIKFSLCGFQAVFNSFGGVVQDSGINQLGAVLVFFSVLHF